MEGSDIDKVLKWNIWQLYAIWRVDQNIPDIQVNDDIFIDEKGIETALQKKKNG